MMTRCPQPATRSVAVGVVRVGESCRECGGFGARDLLRQIEEHRAQMFPVTEQIFGSSGAREEEGKNMLVRFLDVAGGAGEDEVVAAIVGALAFARRHVVEGDSLGADATPAVGAHRPVPPEQPLARVGVGVPACRE